MSIETERYVRAHVPYTGAEFAVIYFLASVANSKNDYRVWMTVGRIAEECRFGKTLVRRALGKAVRDGFLRIARNSDPYEKGKKTRARIYEVLMDETKPLVPKSYDSGQYRPEDTVSPTEDFLWDHGFADEDAAPPREPSLPPPVERPRPVAKTSDSPPPPGDGRASRGDALGPPSPSESGGSAPTKASRGDGINVSSTCVTYGTSSSEEPVGSSSASDRVNERVARTHLSPRCKNGDDNGTPETTPTPPQAAEAAEQPALFHQPDPIQQVFDHWVTSNDKTARTVLDKKRRRLIEKALAEYPLQDVLDAVEGPTHSEFHSGRNDRKRVYNDLALVLRDATKIEMMRDYTRSSRRKVVKAPRTLRAGGLSVEEFAAESGIDVAATGPPKTEGLTVEQFAAESGFDLSRGWDEQPGQRRK